MTKVFFTVCFTLYSMSCVSQGIIGNWKTIDDETGEPKSIVKIYEQDGKVFGEIVEILNPKRKNAVCDNCEGDLKDKPILGMTIIKDMVKDDDVYEDGTIFNPSTGKLYKCRLMLTEDPNRLQVRGYVAFFYKTQYWERIK